MTNIVVKTLPNDSVRIRYSVRLEDGTLLSMSGFACTLTVKRQPSDASPLATATGTVQTPDTSAVVILPPNSLSQYGTYYAVVRVASSAESFSESFTIQVVQ